MEDNGAGPGPERHGAAGGRPADEREKGCEHRGDLCPARAARSGCLANASFSLNNLVQSAPVDRRGEEVRGSGRGGTGWEGRRQGELPRQRFTAGEGGRGAERAAKIAGIVVKSVFGASKKVSLLGILAALNASCLSGPNF